MNCRVSWARQDLSQRWFRLLMSLRPSSSPRCAGLSVLNPATSGLLPTCASQKAVFSEYSGSSCRALEHKLASSCHFTRLPQRNRHRFVSHNTAGNQKYRVLCGSARFGLVAPPCFPICTPLAGPSRRFILCCGLDGMRPLVTAVLVSAHSLWTVSHDEPIEFGSTLWWIYLGICTGLVVLAGIMSGLTLGLMSISEVDVEVLQRSGTEHEKKQADAILPLVKKQHQLLVTLLLCNAAAMEALPIFLDKMFNPVVAVVLSVTFVLAFGEVIPQAVCTRYGLAVGANLAPFVKLLMIVCFVVAYPIGKCLDYVLGHDKVLFRRSQLKALVSIHAKDAGKGGELSLDETLIISGALDLTTKTAEEAMTPIESTFSLDVNTKLDWEAMGKIITRGHSRIPVYSGNTRNIIGILLVKSLLTVRAEQETPVSAVSIRRIPRVPSDMPLYDILNEFQKGSSHMAAVIRASGDKKAPHRASRTHKTSAKDLEKGGNHAAGEVAPVLKADELGFCEDLAYQPKTDFPHENWGSLHSENAGHSLDDHEEAEVIGIITLEDVIEELLQEEIVDETDEYVDVHRRIRVAAALARNPSLRRLHSNWATVGVASKSEKALDDDSVKIKKSVFRGSTDKLSEPLLASIRDSEHV